ncbi:hypothetical protein Pmani_007120 [Petrolisthes manimaculis]|uniref:Lipocalin/cytosolic fatty-acid binding domain-containing protein n=1 Tax=Petrolisthes manimaculis TaxID=1843537 RepID=A0AAE1QBI1_9EUCA|nr:hypothetical protein Pmani_007120 [Petrolisthes manimaculis]
MFSVVLLAALATCVAGDALPEYLLPGKCALPDLQDRFDLRRYSGRWYWSHIIENEYLPMETCVHSQYDYSYTDYGFKVRTAGFNSDKEYLRLEGQVYPTKEFPAAHMLLDFPTVFAAPYQVLATDYESYSCIYSCIDTNGFKSEFGFVFSRSPTSDGSAEAKCAAVFAKNGIDFSRFQRVSHNADCIYKA